MESESPDDQAKYVNGYLKPLCEFKYCIILIMTTKLFEVTDMLSKQLQNCKVYAGDFDSISDHFLAKLQKKHC